MSLNGSKLRLLDHDFLGSASDSTGSDCDATSSVPTARLWNFINVDSVRRLGAAGSGRMAGRSESRLRLLHHESALASASDDSGSEGYDVCSMDYDSDTSSKGSTTSSATSASSSASSSSRRAGSPPPLTHQPPQLQLQQHRLQQPADTASAGSAEVMTFHSQEALWDSLTYITSMKEMCDVTFHVGTTRHPVYGVKSILSARSRIMFQNILFAQRTAAGQKSSKRDKKKLRSRRKRAEELDDGRVHVDVINYDVTVFSQVVGFLHSGRVKVDEGTALGLYCAATEYEVRDLRAACWDFIVRCVRRGHAHSLMTSGRPYLTRKPLDKLFQSVHSEDWETAV